MGRLVRKDNHDIAIVGTSETVLATCPIADAQRLPDGRISYEYGGGASIHWDTMETKTNAAGEILFVDENGEDVPESGVEVIEED